MTSLLLDQSDILEYMNHFHLHSSLLVIFQNLSIIHIFWTKKTDILKANLVKITNL